METKHQFPIATFTATAIYGGIEDMYAETRDSLILNNPINYFGYVKRDNIEVQINPINSNNIENANDKEYLAAKHKFLLEQIKYELVDNRKVLIYFPLIKSILSFKEYLERHASDNLLESIAIYHGRLQKSRKTKIS